MSDAETPESPFIDEKAQPLKPTFIYPGIQATITIKGFDIEERNKEVFKYKLQDLLTELVRGQTGDKEIAANTLFKIEIK